jgi:hypothetical protein
MLHIESYQSISHTCCVESSITIVNSHTICKYYATSQYLITLNLVQLTVLHAPLNKR